MPAEKRLACVLPDYPARGGRTGYAVGLDTPASAVAMAGTLRAAGYDVGPDCDAPALIAALSEGPHEPTLTLAEYESELAAAPSAFQTALRAAWGEPAADPCLIGGAFCFRFLRLGKLIVAVQPDRGDPAARKGDYHDLTLPPRHAYVAFHFWLTRNEGIDALIQLGAHGTLEWLPGKAVALSETCAPEVLIGATPVIYPFIVNNPGEAAQAKRRIGAATIGHLTPPLIPAGSHGAALELEGLFDEFVQAQGLDPRRARAIAALILERGQATGLLKECAAEGKPPEEALIALDGWLCDLKDMRIGDGLHVFGRSPENAEAFASGLELDADAAETLRERVADCGAGESLGLIRALAGRFVEPGPAGAPARGRLDVLPTGRNLFAIDPRSAPTRNAWEIGRRAAGEVLARYAQDHGAWPKRIVLDLWGSATMRTGGDDLAQAFALLGCRPTWDLSSNRVSGFEILPLAMLGRPRVDVTLRISGLFRDVFPSQIALFSAATRPSPNSMKAWTTIRSPASREQRWPGCSARRRAPMALGSDGASLKGNGPAGRIWPRPICPRRATPMTAMATVARRPPRSVPAWPAPTPLFMRRTCRARTRSTRTPFPSMRAASQRPRPTSAPILRSTISIRAHPRRQKSVRSNRRSHARCAAAPPIHAGLPARCATAIGARAKSRSRSTISTPSPR